MSWTSAIFGLALRSLIRYTFLYWNMKIDGLDGEFRGYKTYNRFNICESCKLSLAEREQGTDS